MLNDSKVEWVGAHFRIAVESVAADRHGTNWLFGNRKKSSKRQRAVSDTGHYLAGRACRALPPSRKARDKVQETPLQ